ncbi:MAG: hypothetical protein RQ824_03255 [bacterium]|nr:hypothetical protein [bacterium]
MNTKSNTNILVVGFQPFNEKMYPHTYDFLKLIDEYAHLTYYGGDNSAVERLKIGLKLSSLANVLIHPLTMWAVIMRYFFVNRRIRKEIKKIMEQHFDVVIAMDHSSLNYSSDFIKKGTKLIFWSYDIISEDHVWRKSCLIRSLLKENRNKIHRCNLIMIQDRNRRAVLDSVLNSHDIPNFYLPVSLRFCNIQKKPLQKGKDEIILMQTGSIHELRASDQLIAHYQNMERNINLVLHGHIAQSISTMIESVERRPQIYPLARRMEDMREKISRAHIGFIANCSKNINDFFYSKTSGQLVEFLMQGIPVIVYDSEELGAFIRENKCGIYISTMDNLDQAIKDICADYSAFADNAKKVFFTYFNLDTYGDKIKKMLIN